MRRSRNKARKNGLLHCKALRTLCRLQATCFPFAEEEEGEGEKGNQSVMKKESEREADFFFFLNEALLGGRSFVE